MSIKLTVRWFNDGDVVESQHPFTRRLIVVGRNPDCDLVLPGSEVRVRRRHVEIRREGDHYRLFDLGSKNGTLLNNEIIEPMSVHELQQGDVVKLGGVEINVNTITIGGRVVTARRQQPLPEKSADASTAAPPQPTAMKAQAALDVLRALSSQFTGKEDFPDEASVLRFGELLLTTLRESLSGTSGLLETRRKLEAHLGAMSDRPIKRRASPITRAGGDARAFQRWPLDWTARRPDEVRDLLREAFASLSEQQMGVMAGIQQVMASLERNLSPEQIADEDAFKTGFQKFNRERADIWGDVAEGEAVDPSDKPKVRETIIDTRSRDQRKDD